ncbi:MAG: nuclease [Piscirickettsiaceae bacterium]|nr:MAG: nuclease [Piscirickettsiaceae bacterium]
MMSLLEGMMLRDYDNKNTIKKGRGHLLLAIIISFCLIVVVDIQSHASSLELVNVTHVIDGDTVVLDDQRHVRLLGINAPEVSHGNGVNEAGGIAAKELLKSLLKNAKVMLEKDAEAFDQYGRTLAYLRTSDGININRELVRRGVAAVNIYPPNVKYSRELIGDQTIAEIEGLGIWQMPDYQLHSIGEFLTNKRKGWGRYQSTVTHIDVERKGAKLWLGAVVYIWINSDNLKYFSDVYDYLNQSIEVRGWPRKWGKYWSIQARHPSQIIVQPS